MLQDFFLMLVSTFILQPAQAELGARLARLHAPPAVISQVTGCVTAARPVLARVYGEDPLHGVVSVFRVWTGMTTYQAVLQAEVPACHAALEAAQPFIGPAPG
ncbi:hypothetical protein [Roseomonas sp. 18066]|uniref:hypothetical protein n=1 Tax=Roseomonas sp. 18066 TaxID=2681412 RepID=UPI00135BE59B|nr:hypothetical protein [Roseomonas sp. 18066]